MFKPRASSLGSLIPKSGKMGVTVEKELLKQLISHKYGKIDQIKSKFLSKGTTEENASIDLYCDVVLKRPVKKNKDHFENDYLTGTPDIIIDKVVDIKSSWSAKTFFECKLIDKLSHDYEWQLRAYMELTGLKNAQLAYCLVNTPLNLIEKEFYYESLKYPTGKHLDRAIKQIEANHIHDMDLFLTENPDYTPKQNVEEIKRSTISPEKRVHTIDIARDQSKVDLMHEWIDNLRLHTENKFSDL